jgi:hypothetical protein
MSNIATPRILHVPESKNAAGQPNPWIWPLPKLDGTAPCILAPSRTSLSDEIEIGYLDRSSSPGLVPVFAAQDGIITYAGTARGTPTLCIDHPGGWSTQYSELAHVLARPTDRFRRRRKERVRAGDIVGHAPRTSLCIRFALSQLTDDGCVVVDPGPWMPAWSALPWCSIRTSPPRTLRLTA